MHYVFYVRCIKFYDEYKIKPWISKIELKENSGDFCEMLSWGEVWKLLKLVQSF